LATVAIIVGVLLWIFGAHDDPRILILQHEVDALQQRLRESHPLDQILASKPTSGATGPAGPSLGRGNTTLTWPGRGQGVTGVFGVASGIVLPPPIENPVQDDQGGQ
jgi:hypothetical protein